MNNGIFSSAADAENETLRDKLKDMKAELRAMKAQKKDWYERAQTWFEYILPEGKYDKRTVFEAFRKYMEG